MNHIKCPFNEIHFLPPAGIEEHKRTCPDRDKGLVRKDDPRAEARVSNVVSVVLFITLSCCRFKWLR